MASQRTYPREFKLQAVASVSVKSSETWESWEACWNSKWKQRMKADGEQGFPGKGWLKEDEKLIRRLQRENEPLLQDLPLHEAA